MPTSSSSPSESHPAPGELVHTRALAASPAEVFRAFSDPARLAQWFGPAGFTNRFEAFEFRPGGEWRVVMRGPDGAEFPNRWRFAVIEPPMRLVLVHEGPMHRFELEVTLTSGAAGAGTRLTWRQRFDDAGEVERLGAFLRPANEQNLDRLQALLASAASFPSENLPGFQPPPPRPPLAPTQATARSCSRASLPRRAHSSGRR